MSSLLNIRESDSSKSLFSSVVTLAVDKPWLQQLIETIVVTSGEQPLPGYFVKILNSKHISFEISLLVLKKQLRNIKYGVVTVFPVNLLFELINSAQHFNFVIETLSQLGCILDTNPDALYDWKFLRDKCSELFTQLQFVLCEDQNDSLLLSAFGLLGHSSQVQTALKSVLVRNFNLPLEKCNSISAILSELAPRAPMLLRGADCWAGGVLKVLSNSPASIERVSIDRWRWLSSLFSSVKNTTTTTTTTTAKIHELMDTQNLRELFIR